jgi:hypothetical protein
MSFPDQALGLLCSLATQQSIGIPFGVLFMRQDNFRREQELLVIFSRFNYSNDFSPAA